MSFIVLQITSEWHEKHVEHPSGMGRVPVIRAKGETILDPVEVAHILKHRPGHVQKRSATADEAAEIQAMLDARKPKAEAAAPSPEVRAEETAHDFHEG